MKYFYGYQKNLEPMKTKFGSHIFIVLTLVTFCLPGFSPE